MDNTYEKTEFLKKYNIDIEIFTSTYLDWENLQMIIIDYRKHIPKLESIASMLSNNLMKMNKVHSVRYRIKAEEHLLEKIIRKKIQNVDRVIDIDNYLY